MQQDWCLIRRLDTEKDPDTQRWKPKAEIGGLYLEAKEDQGLPAATRNKEGAMDSTSESPEGTSPANTSCF